MNLQAIRDMFEYNEWATRRILSAAEKTTPEQLTAPSGQSYENLRATLVHILDAEQGWRSMFEGRGFTPEMNPADLPTFAAIRGQMEAEIAAMWKYLDGLREEDMTRIVRYEAEGGILRERLLWHCLYHVVNHGTQHRGEAADLLTRYGQSPGDLDFTVFLNERKARLGS